MTKHDVGDVEGRVPTQDEKARHYRIHAECMGRIAKLMEEVASVRGEVTANRNGYKKIGGDYKQIQDIFRLEDHEDPVEFLNGLNEMAAIAGLISAEEDGGQHSFLPTFDPPSGVEVEKLAMGRVQADGYNSAMAGGPLDNNPHQAGTEKHALWAKAWKQGDGDRRDADKIAIIPSNEVRRGRGRPRKNPDAEAQPMRAAASNVTSIRKSAGKKGKGKVAQAAE